MSGLLSGLSSLGLGNLETSDIFEEPKKKKGKDPAKAEKVDSIIQEKDLIFDRTYTCPVCDAETTSKVVKSGKARLLHTDMDLRPKYEVIDTLKYDVVLCTHCGFAALSRYFKVMAPSQAKAIKVNITKNIHLHAYNGEIYSYEEALERYKLALACAIVRQSKPSEKAYICLKSAWLIRGQSEELDETADDYDQKKEELAAMESNYLENALEGFMSAKQTEDYPMCGMDENTVDYLIAVLATRFEKYDVASRLVASLLTSASVNSRMKDKARDLKDEILKAIKH